MTSFRDRYQELGLRRNPFAAWQLDEPIPDAFVSRGVPDPPMPKSKTLVQVIGESGYGKSTHLHHWRKQSPGPYHYIPRRPLAARRTTPPLEDLVYGDEIDRMPRSIRRRWFYDLAARNATLVIGTHADLSRLGRRAGFTVVTHWLAPIGLDDLEKMITARLENESTRPDSFRFTDDEIREVLLRSDGVPGQADVVCHQLLAQRALQLTGSRHQPLS